MTTFSEPRVQPLLCLLFHSWKKLDVPASAKARLCTTRRGCRRCGRIDMKFSFTTNWNLWGYLEPQDIAMTLDEMVAKYVPNHNSRRSVTAPGNLAVESDVFVELQTIQARRRH